MTYLGAFDKDYTDPYGKPITCAEWYDTHESAKPYRDRVMKSLHRLRFKSLWNDIVNEYEENSGYLKIKSLYGFANDVRKLAGMPKMSRKMYDEGRIYRHVFAGSYEYGLEEMWLLCWGDW